MDREKLMDTLIPQAWEAAKNAYVPYSSFQVGAALLTPIHEPINDTRHTPHV